MPAAKIPPSADLIFEIEVLSVTAGKPPGAGGPRILMIILAVMVFGAVCLQATGYGPGSRSKIEATAQKGD